MATQSESINLDHLKVDLTRKPNCMIQLDIAVDPVATKAAHLKATKQVNKEVSIPGFRKGKAPDALVEQQYGKFIQQEWRDILINTAFKEFLAKTHLYPFTTDRSVKKAEIKSLSLDNGAQVVIEYEAKPEIPNIDPATLQLKPIAIEPVTEEEIDETMRQIQLHHSQWHDVHDRSVQEGDFVDLTIDALEDPVRSICKELRFEVAEKKMGAWMRNLILGQERNAIVEGMSERDDSIKEDADFKPTLCRIEIHKIRTAEIPALDDELAKKVGVQTMEELRPRVKADLERRAEGEVQDQKRAQVEEFLLSNYQFDIPHSLIEAQHQTRDPKAAQELDKAYRLFFLSRKIADEQNIQVNDRDIMSEMLRQMALPENQRIIDLKMPPEEVRSKLFVNVLSQKVLDFLASKAS